MPAKSGTKKSKVPAKQAKQSTPAKATSIKLTEQQQKVTAISKPGAYDFCIVDVDANEVGNIAKRLRQLNQPKEYTVKALKQLVTLLESAPQDATVLGVHGDNLASSLLSLSTDSKADKDVKLYAAQAMVLLMRVYAPDLPYDDAQLQAMFQVLTWCLDRLSQPGLPTFASVVSILHVIAETKLYMLLLDLEASDVLEGVCEALLMAVRDNNLEAVEVAAQQVLVGLLIEGGGEAVSDRMLSCYIRALAGTLPGGGAAQKLAGRVLHQADAALKPGLQRLLAQLVCGEVEGMPSQLRGLNSRLPDLLLQVYTASPSLLLPVMPQLVAELESSHETRREAAAGLTTHLFCAANINMVEEYTDLTKVYLQRYYDVVPSIRVLMVEATSRLAADSTGAMQEQVLKLAAERLDDNDEAVRVAAVNAICEQACQRLDRLPGEVQQAVMLRLRDAKPTVRKAAATGLVMAFKTLATEIAATGSLPDTLDGTMLSFPGRLAAAAIRDSELRQAAHNLLISPGLLPAVSQQAAGAGTPSSMATVWAMVWHASDVKWQEGLITLLRSKTELAANFAYLLTLHKKLAAHSKVRLLLLQGTRPVSQEEAAAYTRRIDRLCGDVVRAVMGPVPMDSHTKSVSAIKSLLEARDTKIADRLEVLCLPTTSEADARAARKDVCERLGSKTPLGKFTALLTAACMPTLITTSAVQAVAQLALHHPTQDKEDTTMDVKATVTHRQAAAQLLCAVAKHASALCVTALPHLADCLVQCVPCAPREVPQGTLKAKGKGKAARAADGAAAASHLEVHDVGAATTALKVLANSSRTYAHLVNKNIKLTPLPQGLQGVLRRLCVCGPPKLASVAMFVLAGLANYNTHHGSSQEGDMEQENQRPAPAKETGVISEWVDTLAASLTSDKAETPEGLAAVHALSSVGQFSVERFADHAQDVVTFVTQHLLPSHNPGGVLSSTAAQQQQQAKQYHGVADLQPAAVARAQGDMLMAVAKACSPAIDMGALPSVTHDAALRLVDVLEGLCDIGQDDTCESAQQDGDPQHQTDKAYIRLAAGRALLTLSRRHDVRMPASAYATLGLVVQDPEPAVRACFGAKLSRHVLQLQASVSVVRQHSSSSSSSSSGAPWLPSKYAAMLALAGVEPLPALQAAAATALKGYCVAKRASAQAALQAAALLGDSSNTLLLQNQPEFMLPYLLYILAVHPDCPAVEPNHPPGNTGSVDQPMSDSQQEEEEQAAVAETLQPFSDMLQLLLEPLLLLPDTTSMPAGVKAGGRSGAAGTAGGGQAVLANLPLVKKMLKTVKLTELVQGEPEAQQTATHCLRTICDLGSQVAAAIVRRECEAAGVAVPASLPDHPATIVLPKNLFDVSQASRAGAKVLAAQHLPPGYEAVLNTHITGLFQEGQQAGRPAGKATRQRAGKGMKRGGRVQPTAQGQKRSKPRRKAKGDGDDNGMDDKGIGNDSSEGDHEGSSDVEVAAAQQIRGRPRAVANKRRKAAQQPDSGGANVRRQPSRAGRAGNMAVDIEDGNGSDVAAGNSTEDDE